MLEARKLAKSGHELEPMRLEGTKIASSVWGKAWCRNLEAYSDFANRLPRGRSYLRSGAVVDLRIAEGRIDARVAGSSLYKVVVEIDKLPQARFRDLAARCAGRIDSVVDLLQGRLPEALLETLIDRSSGLFPAPKQMRFSCSCPDYAALCKHIAAVFYGIGARFDKKPETFFTLRSVRMEDLVTKSTRLPPRQQKADASLARIFGIELDQAPLPRRRSSRAPRKAASKASPKRA